MVISRLRSLIGRYDDVHLSLQAQPQLLRNETGQEIGKLTKISYRKGRLHLEGRLQPAQNYRAWLQRGQSKFGIPLATDGKFTVYIPLGISHLASLHTLQFGYASVNKNGRIEEILVSLAWRQGTIILLKLRWRFAVNMLRCLPALISLIINKKPETLQRVKRLLQLEIQTASPLVTSEIWNTTKTQTHRFFTDVPVTILLPVYNAMDLLPETLRRIESYTDIPYRLLILEDCSSDPSVRPFLREWAAERAGQVELIEHAENRGFLDTVNDGFARALAQADRGPVILLNSDAWLPEGWASRLVAPIHADESIASVTPMSNNAEIFTVPQISQPVSLPSGAVDKIDGVARNLSGDRKTSTPTGVGFCMALSHSWLERIPQFDTLFAPGYGEEVDWCQKIALQGGRHVVVGNLFVEHTGGHSFGSERKQALIREHNAIITHRYPDYDRSVQAFAQYDPLADIRLALAITWAGCASDGRAVPIYLAHTLGGGAEFVLQHTLKQHCRDSQPAIVLRVTSLDEWGIELQYGAGKIIQARVDSFDTIRRLLAPLPHKHITYSCGVGAKDAALLPGQIMSLLGGADSVDVLFHDFLPLSPSYTLLDSDHRFRGTPITTEDPAHQYISSFLGRVNLKDWQNLWYRLASKARLKVFSSDSAKHVAAVWPDLKEQIEVTPHSLLNPVPSISVSGFGRPVIAILGNINRHKGLSIVRAIAQTRKQHNANAKIILIGKHDPSLSLPRDVMVHGQYQVTDLDNLVSSYGITHWLIPSVWPETFCFTVHEALATGMPVYAFDLGAQGDAVRLATNGHPLPYTPNSNLAEVFWASFKLSPVS